MKRKYKFLFCLLTLNSLNQLVLANNLPLGNKIISKNSFSTTKLKSDTYNLFELQKFLRNLVANLNDSEINYPSKFNDIEILSDKQINSKDKLVVEGNIVVKSKNAILKADRLVYDKNLKIFYIKGSIEFKADDQFIIASEVKYDLRNKKGFLKDIYGSVNLNKLGQLRLKSDSDIENLNENSLTNKDIKNVISSDVSTLGLSPRKIKVDFGKIQKWRFKSDQINIENDVWVSEKIIITNDPYNKPQLLFKNHKFLVSNQKGDLLFKSKWSSLVLDNKLSIPLGRRKIKQKDQNDLKWGVAYDKSSKDGIFIIRKADPINLFDEKLKLTLSKSLNIQRALNGKTKSFSGRNKSALAKKVSQSIKTSDIFGVDADFEAKILDFNFNANTSFNSLDFEKFNKIIRVKSELSKVLNQDRNQNSNKQTELSFFGNYREKIWNGSLGNREILSAYGIKLEKQKDWLDKNIKKSSKVAAGYGYYESSARNDSYKIINSNRLNISLERFHSYPIWNPEIKNNISSDYKYIPTPIKKGLNFNVQTMFDFFRYENYNFQNLYTFKAGPEMTLGNFKNKFFDYSRLSIYPKLTLARGKSPFDFDQSVDNHSIELNLEQQLYGPLTMNYSTEFNLDINSENYKEFYNTQFNLNWNRRAYKIGLFYNEQSKSGGINFKIHMFNFDGLGSEF